MKYFDPSAQGLHLDGDGPEGLTNIQVLVSRFDENRNCFKLL